MEARGQLREAILEAQIEASLWNHDLGPFNRVEAVTGGLQAECRLYGATSWVGDKGIRYSLLEDICPSRKKEG